VELEDQRLAEVVVAARSYEQALAEGDTVAAADWFAREDPVTRFGPDGFQHGADEVRAKRLSTAKMDVATWLHEEVRWLGPSAALHLALLHRGGAEIQRSQVWLQGPEGWRLCHAHVSRRSISHDGVDGEA
jgi:hypothetical protein